MSSSLGTRPSAFFSHFPQDTSESDPESEEEGIGEGDNEMENASDA